MELHLPLGVDMEPDRPREDIRTHSGAPSAVDLGQEEHRQFKPPNGAMSKWPRHRLPFPIIREPRSPVTGAMANLVRPGIYPAPTEYRD